MTARLKIDFLFVTLLFFSCTKDSGKIKDGSEFPNEVASVISTNCSISGCHNKQSKEAAAGLSLLSWNSLFDGSRNGAVIIPYRPDFSTLCFYTNSFPDLGPVLDPRMPVGLQALSKIDYLLLVNWIKKGARNSNGEIKFQYSRSKLYVINQLCDVVMVLDGKSKLQMRCIDVGSLTKSEFPVCIKVSPDNRFWYVTFLASPYVLKYDAIDDSYVGKINLGEGIWSTFEITSDSKHAFFIDNSNEGKIAYVDLEKMIMERHYTNPHYVYPRSAAINNAKNKLYVGSENGNYISIIDFTNSYSPVTKQLILNNESTTNNVPKNDPVFLLMHEASNVCFVACRNSQEVKIIDLNKDSVLASIFLNAAPTAMDYSIREKRLFVSCMDDSLSFHGNLGSVKIISLETNQIIKTINSGYQPNGITINQEYSYAAVVNSNISPKGPQPHHTSGCKGRNGYVTFIDLSTLELIQGLKLELAVYPSGISLRN